MNPKLKPMLKRFRTMPALPRQVLGVALLLGGVFWFLPVLGLWMIPLGLMILSLDFQWARRSSHKINAWLNKWRARRKPGDEIKGKR
ncbi:MAG: hypothetical protein OXG56_03995 [Gammaproteobacteria bacterium]|nr:hypothetical protein [Gammaproteobacteria bacterium]